MQIKQLLLKLKSLGLDVTTLHAKDVELENSIKALQDLVGNSNVSEEIRTQIETALQEFGAEIDTKIAENTDAIQAEVERATLAEEALQAAIDAEVSRAEAAELAITDRLDLLEDTEDVEGSIAHSIKEAITELETNTTQAIEDAKTEAISEAKAYTDEEIEKINTTSSELADRVTALEEKDVELEADIAAVDAKVDALQEVVDGIETTWDAVTGKPFEVLGNTLEVSLENKALDVKVDNTTIEASVDGALKVKDGVFALEGHNHDSEYASKDHELNEDIHLTSEEKTNVGKIPTIESDVNLLKTTVGASSTHIIVDTVAELTGLIDTCNHATIAHVIETNETYILEKDSDINGNQITPEWIKLSDADALVSVDWNIISNKPFSTVAEGLVTTGDALAVSVDDTTVEIKDGKVAVKDGVFAEAGHTHVIDFNDVINKPVAFKQSYTVDNFVDGVDLDEGLFSLDVQHNKNSTNLKVTVIGNDNIERLVGIEYTDENTVKIWTDEKESVTVVVNSFDYTTTTIVDTVTKAIVGQAKIGIARI